MSPATPGYAAGQPAPYGATPYGASPSGESPVCAETIKTLDACPPLDEHASIRQPSGDAAEQARQLDSLMAMSRQGVRQMCPSSNVDAHFANQDRCLAQRREEGKQEQAEQRKRLPAERGRVASVHGDPRYAAALDRYRRATTAVRRAREDREDAKQRLGLDCAHHSEDCQRDRQLQQRIGEAEHDEAQAEGLLRQITSAHHIDERDGQELGLW